VIALFDFTVPKPAKQLEEERMQAVDDVLPVFNLDHSVFADIHAEIDTLFSVIASFSEEELPDSVRSAVEKNLAGKITYSEIMFLRRVAKDIQNDSDEDLKNILKRSFNYLSEYMIVFDKNNLKNITKDIFMLEEVELQRTMKVENILGIDDARKLLRDTLPREINTKLSKKDLQSIQALAERYLRPNLYYNIDRTDELYRHAMDAVPLYMASYKKNERIIDANVPVTESHIAALEAYRNELEARSFEENRLKHYAVALGKTIIALGVIGVLISYIFLYRKKIFQSFPRLLLLTLLLSIPLSAAYYSAWSGGVSEYLVPVALATILTAILFDAELGIMVSFGISLFVSSLVGVSGIRLGLIYFLAGSVGALTVGHVRHRKEFYRSMIFIPVTMVLAVVATHDWIGSPHFTDFGMDILFAAANGFLCPIVAIGLLPLLESTFKIATDITLLELSDLNNPLLKEMAVKAPGTFSGSLVVGALAEAGAEKIGANPLLARVGAYYHDIGKIMIPEYFIENQFSGENPHDRLTPHMSALVIVSHVKEGYELGFKYGLPEAILDIIRQHHGTSLIASIYHKAVEDAGKKNVDESAFRYPGPKPQTREAGIVMLADLVEAASRSVSERSPGRLKTLINTIIQQRFMEGELDECNVTLRDINNIELSFLPVLVGSQHGRIKYPWQDKENEKKSAQLNSGGLKTDTSMNSVAAEKKKNDKD